MTGQYSIGIDLGGTSIKAAGVTRGGEIISQAAIDSYAQRNPEAVMGQLVEAIKTISEQHAGSGCLGVGIGSPGVVNAEGVVKYPPNFRNWSDVPLRDEISRRTGLRVEVENDANAAAIAEARFGAGKDHKDFLFVIWGTGVGGGIVLDGAIFRGPEGGAGEIGHTTIDHNGPPCNCGGRGCIEAYIGQRYLSARAKVKIEQLESAGSVSVIRSLTGGDLDAIEPALISKAAEQGDRIARDILVEAGTLLGYSLASVLNVLDLRVVVIGGGISAAPDYVYEAMSGALKERVLRPYKASVRVLRAELGNKAGMLGAASLVM